MKISTINVPGGTMFVCIQGDGFDLDIMANQGETAKQALERMAEETAKQAVRMLKMSERYTMAANTL